MNEMLNRGVSPDQFIEVVIDRFRLLMLACACGVESDLLELADDEREEIASQAQRFDAPGLVYMIALLENVQRSIKSSVTGRALLDAAVVRLAMSEKFADAAALLKGGAAASGGGSAPATQKKSPARGEGVPRLSDLAASAARTTAPVKSEPKPVAAATPETPVIVDPDALWRQVVAEAHKNVRLGPVVDALSWDKRLDGPSIALTLGDGSLLAYAKTCLGAIEKIFGAALGRPTRVELVVSPSAESNGRPTNEAAAARADYEAAAQIPLVRKAMDMLDARIIGVEPAPRSKRS
jgi:hypothetical protein